LHSSSLCIIFRSQAPFERQWLSNTHLPPANRSIQEEEGMFGCAKPAEIFQLLKRHRLGYIPRLRIPGDEIPEFLTGKILRDTGMSDKIDHKAIVSTDLARQEIRERLLQ